MIRSIKLLLFLILFLIPGFVCAKEFNATVSKPINFVGGSSLMNYGKVDEEFVNRLKKINVASTSSFEVDRGLSGAIYYDDYHTPGNYPFGIYAIPTSMGTYSNLDFSILYSKLLIIGDKSYDVKLKVNSVYDEEGGSIIIAPNRIVTTLDEYFVNEKNTNNRYRGFDFSIDIYESGTNVKAKIPGLIMGIYDIDGQNGYYEGYKINDFVPNKKNTFLYGYNNGLNYNDSFYGLVNSDFELWSKGNAFFRISKLENGETINLSYASNISSEGFLIHFFLPSYKIVYQAKVDDEITYVKTEDKLINEKLEQFNNKKDGYDLTYFTCDKDVNVLNKTILAGNQITIDEFKEIVIEEDLVLTAHYEKHKYKIATKVVGGTIDETSFAISGDDKTVSYAAFEGYHLKSIKIDGENVDVNKYSSFYTFENINDDHLIEVVFEINKYKITTRVVGGYIDNSKEVSYGSNETINYSPKEGYRLYKVLVDGILVNFPKYYDFLNVQENHTIEVYYELIPSVEVQKSSDKQDVKEGDVITYNLNLKQVVDGAIARDVVLTDTFSKNLILDNNSLALNNDIEILEISETHFKIKIKELKDKKTISYKVKVRDDLAVDEISNNVLVTVDNNEDEAVTNNKVYVPREEVKISKNKKDIYYNDVVTYSVSVIQKTKGATFHNAVLSSILPPELELLEVLSGRNKAVISGNKFEIFLGNIKNEEVKISFKVKIKDIKSSVRTNIFLNGDELVYPLENSDLLKIKNSDVSIKKKCSSLNTYLNSKITCTIKVFGNNLRNVAVTDIISNKLKVLPSSIKTDGRFSLNRNKLIVNYDYINGSKSITYDLKTIKTGRAINNTLVDFLGNKNDSKILTTLVVIKNKLSNKDSVLKTKIPMTFLNDNVKEIFIAIILTFALFVIIFIIKTHN